MKKGFTLIELLVVVLIIGVLAAVAVPQYKVAVYKSKYATLKHIVESIKEAQEVYYLANGTYADDFEHLDVVLPSGKLAGSSAKQYQYAWGFCDMGATDADKYLACVDSKIKMRYQVYPKHSVMSPGKKVCLIYGTVSDLKTQANVCKQETGSVKDGTLMNNSVTYWFY